jgi:hypothetical protein
MILTHLWGFGDRPMIERILSLNTAGRRPEYSWDLASRGGGGMRRDWELDAGRYDLWRCLGDSR